MIETTPPKVDLHAIKISCGDCTLTELCLPRGLGSEAIQALDENVKRRKPLDRGRALYREGDAMSNLYAVRSGSFKTFVESADGDEQIVGFHVPGELIGFDAFESGDHTCSAKALETSSVCELPMDKLEALCREVPGLQHQMHRLIGRELTHDHGMLLLLGKKSAEERLAAFLLSLSNRFKERGFSDHEFNLSMSRHDIANYLGLAVETVSRLFGRLHDEGIINVEKRHVWITDLEALKSMVSGCMSPSSACGP